MKGIAIRLWMKNKFSRRFRLGFAILLIFILLGLLFFYLPSILPRYHFTLADRFTFLTPRSFSLGQLYDFTGSLQKDETLMTYASGQSNELVLPRPDKKTIVFKYPEVVTLGRPTFLGNDITQSVDFTVKNPPATGLIQIWVLSSTLEEFLETSKSYSSIEYSTFTSRNEKKDALSYTLWDYTFQSGERTIRGLEAFFDDKPYMYRLSVFLDNQNYSEAFQVLFDSMVQSVSVR